MNRPKYDNSYCCSDLEIMKYEKEYINELQKYCDELEHRINSLEKTDRALNDICDKYEKALDMCVDFLIKEVCVDEELNIEKDCEICKHAKMCGIVILGNKKRLKNRLIEEAKKDEI